MERKSSLDDLRKRGYIDDLDISEYEEKTKEDLATLLQDQDAVVRSMAAKALGRFCQSDDAKLAEALLEQLLREKKLYTRLELAVALEQGKIKTAQRMTAYLGMIGSNQYKELPQRPSLKKSYPLPRDLIARSLGRMEVSIAPVLYEILETGSIEEISEVLDAIGFLFFYHPDKVCLEAVEKILDVINRYSDKEIIVWKGIVCLSAFPCEKAVNYLRSISREHNNPLLQMEAERSLRIMKWK